MSDSTIEPLPDGDGKLGNAEGPADAGASDGGMVRRSLCLAGLLVPDDGW